LGYGAGVFAAFTQSTPVERALDLTLGAFCFFGHGVVLFTLRFAHEAEAAD
jgi:hypothetical protein